MYVKLDKIHSQTKNCYNKIKEKNHVILDLIVTKTGYFHSGEKKAAE